LASQFSPECDDQFRLDTENRIAKIVADFALAMRYGYCRGIVHRDLTPATILLDWDRPMRIADAPDIVAIADEGRGWLSIDIRYITPEC
jgi:serine/threonine protein kinase